MISYGICLSLSDWHVYFFFLCSLLAPCGQGLFILYAPPKHLEQSLVWSSCTVNICGINEWTCQLLPPWSAPHAHYVQSWEISFLLTPTLWCLFQHITSPNRQPQLGVQQCDAIPILSTPSRLQGSLHPSSLSPPQTSVTSSGPPSLPTNQRFQDPLLRFDNPHGTQEALSLTMTSLL